MQVITFPVYNECKKQSFCDRFSAKSCLLSFKTKLLHYKPVAFLLHVNSGAKDSCSGI